MSSTYTVLRYPGGKSSLYGFLAQVIELNKIENCTYIEPYAGGAGAAIKLLMKGMVEEIILNDADSYIINFWKSILYRTDEFLKRLRDTQIDIREWQRQFDILINSKQGKAVDYLDSGFAAFFLNRCNWSGILDARPIGGIEQKGKWKINERFNKRTLMRKIKRISRFRQQIRVCNMDALEFLQALDNLYDIDFRRCLVYLDPPYYVQGPSLYRIYYKHEDHLNLANQIKKEYRFRWLLSYDDVCPIHQIYKEVSRNVYNLNYYAHSLKIGKELIMASYDCVIPESFILYSKVRKFKCKNQGPSRQSVPLQL
jgi:DNA adenine methylase